MLVGFILEVLREQYHELEYTGLMNSDMDLTVLQSQKPVTLSTQRRMLTASEIELLQKMGFIS